VELGTTTSRGIEDAGGSRSRKRTHSASRGSPFAGALPLVPHNHPVALATPTILTVLAAA